MPPFHRRTRGSLDQLPETGVVDASDRGRAGPGRCRDARRCVPRTDREGKGEGRAGARGGQRPEMQPSKPFRYRHVSPLSDRSAQPGGVGRPITDTMRVRARARQVEAPPERRGESRVGRPRRMAGERGRTRPRSCPRLRGRATVSEAEGGARRAPRSRAARDGIRGSAGCPERRIRRGPTDGWRHRGAWRPELRIRRIGDGLTGSFGSLSDPKPHPIVPSPTNAGFRTSERTRPWTEPVRGTNPSKRGLLGESRDLLKQQG